MERVKEKVQKKKLRLKKRKPHFISSLSLSFQAMYMISINSNYLYFYLKCFHQVIIECNHWYTNNISPITDSQQYNTSANISSSSKYNKNRSLVIKRNLNRVASPKQIRWGQNIVNEILPQKQKVLNFAGSQNCC